MIVSAGLLRAAIGRGRRTNVERLGRWLGMARPEALADGELARVVARMCFAASIGLTGCTDLESAKTAANALRETGVSAASLLHDKCTRPYQAASRMTPDAARAEVERLDRVCIPAAHAYDALRTAHVTLHAVIVSIEAGQCVNAHATLARCNVLGAMRESALAVGELAGAVEALRGLE